MLARYRYLQNYVNTIFTLGMWQGCPISLTIGVSTRKKRQKRRGITTEKEAKNQFFNRKHGWPLEKPKRIYSYIIRLSSKSFLNINIIVVQSLSHVWFFVTLWTVACQAPLSMEISRQEYWSGLPFPSPGDLPDPETEPMASALAGRFFTTEPPGKSK